MAKNTKYSDYFGNRFDDLESSLRKFRKKNRKGVFAAGLIGGFAVLAGLGYAVFSGTGSSEMDQTTAPIVAPVEQELVHNEIQVPAVTSKETVKQERIQKLFHPKKIAKHKAHKHGKKIAKLKKAKKANLVCVDPSQLKAKKKGRIASTKR